MNLSDVQILEIIKLHQSCNDTEFVSKVVEKYPEISVESAATLDKVIITTLDQLIEMVEGLANFNVNDL